ncbi:MAG: DNA cytosine methyltransferase [Mesorhizobium sp.]|nr:DNA cytosine methyltransferase [Mesorhizobium sp.]
MARSAGRSAHGNKTFKPGRQVGTGKKQPSRKQPEIVEEPEGEPALSPEKQWGARLAGIKTKVMAWRQSALMKAFELGDRWKDLQKGPEADDGADALPELPREHLIAFLASECQIPRREVIRHIRMAETFTEEEKTSRATWTSLGVHPTYHAPSAPGPDAPPPSEGFRPRLTMDMIARLQDFPQGWAFQGSAMQQFRQIANAFPPRMARAMGLSIMRALTGAAIDLDRALAVPVHDPKRPMFAALNRFHCEGEEGRGADND